jgi:hypothetical protein
MYTVIVNVNIAPGQFASNHFPLPSSANLPKIAADSGLIRAYILAVESQEA